MISLRIKPELEKKLTFFAEIKGKSRSEIIVESIIEYIQNHSIEKTPYELGKDLFGKYSSGKTDLSQNRKKYLKEKIIQKHAKRRSN
jgi:predicted DNA-binding protein